MRVLAAIILAVLISMPSVAGATYRLNGHDETEFHEIRQGSLVAYDSDTYIITGSEGMDIRLNISCDAPLLLNVRNSSGSFIYASVEPGNYSTSFSIEGDDEYRIILSCRNSVNYTLEVSSEYHPHLEGLMDYLALSICGVCIIVVFSVIALAYALHRANMRKGGAYAGDGPSDDSPYRVK